MDGNSQRGVPAGQFGEIEKRQARIEILKRCKDECEVGGVAEEMFGEYVAIEGNKLAEAQTYHRIGEENQRELSRTAKRLLREGQQ